MIKFGFFCFAKMRILYADVYELFTYDKRLFAKRNGTYQM